MLQSKPIQRKWSCIHWLSLAVPTGEGSGTPLQHSCMENPVDGGAWWATVHGVEESDMTERLRTRACVPNLGFSSVQFIRSVVSDSETPRIAAHQASLSITNSRSLMSVELVMPSSYLILCRPLLLLPSIPPSIRLFSTTLAFLKNTPTYSNWNYKGQSLDYV